MNAARRCFKCLIINHRYSRGIVNPEELGLKMQWQKWHNMLALTPRRNCLTLTYNALWHSSLSHKNIVSRYEENQLWWKRPIFTWGGWGIGSTQLWSVSMTVIFYSNNLTRKLSFVWFHIQNDYKVDKCWLWRCDSRFCLKPSICCHEFTKTLVGGKRVNYLRRRTSISLYRGLH